MTKKSYTLDDNGGRGASVPPLRVKELPFPMNNVKTEAENEAITGGHRGNRLCGGKNYGRITGVDGINASCSCDNIDNDAACLMNLSIQVQ